MFSVAASTFGVRRLDAAFRLDQRDRTEAMIAELDEEMFVMFYERSSNHS